MDHSNDQHDQHEHHGGLAKYLFVFLALCGLTMCSFLTVQPWWPFAKAPTWIFMMGVSTVKAMLVILVFMHLMWEANWKYVLTIPAGMMSIFLVLMLIPDVGNRWSDYSEERKVFAAELESVSDHGHGEHAEHGEDAHEEHGEETHEATNDAH